MGRSAKDQTADHVKDNPMIRVGYVKAMQAIANDPSVPETVKILAEDCIEIISGLRHYTAKEDAAAELPAVDMPVDSDDQGTQNEKEPKPNPVVNPAVNPSPRPKPTPRFRKRR